MCTFYSCKPYRANGAAFSLTLPISFSTVDISVLEVVAPSQVSLPFMWLTGLLGPGVLYIYKHVKIGFVLLI